MQWGQVCIEYAFAIHATRFSYPFVAIWQNFNQIQQRVISLGFDLLANILQTEVVSTFLNLKIIGYSGKLCGVKSGL